MTFPIEKFMEQVREEELPDSTREERVLAATVAALHLPPAGQGAPLATTSVGPASNASSSGAMSLLSTSAAKVVAVGGAACVTAALLMNLAAEKTAPPPVGATDLHTQEPVALPDTDGLIPPKRSVQPSETPGIVPESRTFRRRPEADEPKERPHVPDGVPPTKDAPQVVANEAEDSSNRAPSLAEELKVLEQVQFALKRGEPHEALRLLDETTGSSPALQEERAAVRVMAECIAQQSQKAQRSARAFVTRYPQSMHREAIEDTCKAR